MTSLKTIFCPRAVLVEALFFFTLKQPAIAAIIGEIDRDLDQG
jgi:hypothetical protein